jgi:hypothetical protein
MQQPMMQQPQVQQIQNGGVINVQSEKDARDYLVANGTSVTFINGNEKKVYVKTKGFSSLDVPTFETYSLVKDESASEAVNDVPFVQKSEFEALKKDFAMLRERIGDMSAKSNANDADA